MGHDAHNEVRIENICFREDQEIDLIDLERRREVGRRDLYGFGMSNMYRITENEDQTQNWMLIKIDFRQLAIMIIYLQSDDHIDYHAIVVEQSLNCEDSEVLYLSHLLILSRGGRK